MIDQRVLLMIGVAPYWEKKMKANTIDGSIADVECRICWSEDEGAVRPEGIQPFPFQRATTLAADAVATDR